MFSSGSIEENNERLTILYQKHHKLFIGTAINLSKDAITAEDLVGDLYLYLGEKIRPKLYYKDSFNIFYCINFLQSRFLNKIKRDKKFSYRADISDDIKDTEYNDEFDNKLDEAYDKVLKEIEEIKKTKHFASAMIYELYWVTHPDDTLKELSERLNICNSTTFKHIKYIKEHLKNNIDNPFL